MTSSGTYAFAATNGSITLSAFERIQIRTPGIRQEHMLNARQELNYLLASFANLQPNLWKVELITVTLVDGTATYTLPARVVMVLDAYITTNNGLSNQNDTIITPISRTDYASYAAKQTPGIPTVYWLDRLITPELTTWPVINTSGYVLNYYACVQMQDAALAGGQTPDIPYLWTDALVAELAHRLARIYAPALEEKREKDAEKAWAIAAAQNTEWIPTKLSPNLGRYYR